MFMLIPFILFWLLIIFGRDQLGRKGYLIAIGVWAVLFIGFSALSISPLFFVAAQAVLDVILIVVILGGDVRIG